MNRFDSIEEKAARWLAREEEGLDPVLRARFDAWLAETDLHRVVYLRLKCAWRQADRLAALKRPEPLSVPSGPVRPWYLPMRALLPVRALAAVLVVGCLGIGGYFGLLTQRDGYMTAVGQRQVLHLSDGTRVELNTDTLLRTKMTADRRTVILERGEAFFDVIHNSKRPFVVLVGDRRIIDVGTKFSVRRDSDHVRVLVSEGRVAVDIPGEKHPGLPVVAKANEVVIAKTDETLIVPKNHQTVADDLSWRRGVLVFNQQTLADAAAQFNRYSTKQIVVKGEARDLRIGGSFRVNNIEGFAQLVCEGFELKVEENGDTITISN